MQGLIYPIPIPGRPKFSNFDNPSRKHIQIEHEDCAEEGPAEIFLKRSDTNSENSEGTIKRPPSRRHRRIASKVW